MVPAMAVLAALAASSHAAPGMPILERALKSARPETPALPDSSLELSRAAVEARSLAREASSLRLAISSLRRRLDGESARAYLGDLKDWSSSLKKLQRRTLRLSAHAGGDASKLTSAAEELYTEASGLSGDATWLAFDLRALSLAREASEAERLTRDGASDSRQLVYDAEAISARAR
jgi:hypothetical protein